MERAKIKKEKQPFLVVFNMESCLGPQTYRAFSAKDVVDEIAKNSQYVAIQIKNVQPLN